MKKIYVLLVFLAVSVISVGLVLQPEFYNAYNIACVGYIFMVSPIFQVGLVDASNRYLYDEDCLSALIVTFIAVLYGVTIWILPAIYVFAMVILFLLKTYLSAEKLKKHQRHFLLSNSVYLLIFDYFILAVIQIVIKGTVVYIL